MSSILNSEDYFGNKLKSILTGISRSIIAELVGFNKDPSKIKIDDGFLNRAVHTMMAFDIPPITATKLLHPLQKSYYNRYASLQDIKLVLYNEIKQILSPYAYPIDIDYNLRPQVIVMCGLNGAGKSTTIWKMLHMLSKYGWRATVAACDTTRESAKECFMHLQNVPNIHTVFQQDSPERPTSIVRRALEIGRVDLSDVILVDTPGFTDDNDIAMRDTSMIIDAIETVRPDAPHNVVLVVDATNGYGAKEQLGIFRGVATITGLVVTKMDIAKQAGLLLSAVDELHVPVYGIGLGCKPEDLQNFSAEEFAEGLSGILV